MSLTNKIISVINNWTSGFLLVAPYQENPANFGEGYATVFQINSTPQTTIEEKVYKNKIELSQLNAVLFQLSFYKYAKYSQDNITPMQAALYLRSMLGSYEAMKKFNDVGLDISPQMTNISLDTFRESDINKYVQHAHFECTFYVTNTTEIESEVFEKIKINKALGI